MNCKIVLPSEILEHLEVTKVVAEAANGSFCLLPRHIDFVSALTAGLLVIVPEGSSESYFAVDDGILVKKGPDVLVSTRNAVRIPDLGQLEQVLEEQFRAMDDREKMARTAAARLEADVVRRFMELRKHG